MIFDKKVVNLFRSRIYVRADMTGDVFYFSPQDFAGLACEPYPFVSKEGARLQGYLYYYGTPSAERIVVFEHGMWSGHRAYMREIEHLASHGYTVFSYDHLGCMESEGDGIKGFGGSLSNLDDCLCTLKTDSRFAKASFSVIGHSWGGYSTLNIAAYHPDVTHIVAFAGFISVSQIIRQSIRGIGLIYRGSIYNLEKHTNPMYVDADARITLKNAKTKALVFHSEDDKLVSFNFHFKTLKKALKNAPNVSFVTLKGRGHNPNYTEDAVRYKDEFFAKLTEARNSGALADAKAKEAFVKSFDWYRMTEQDEAVWAQIFEHLKG